MRLPNAWPKFGGKNAKDARREAARYACVNLAEMSGVAKSKTPQGLAGIITAAVAVGGTVGSAALVGGVVGAAAADYDTVSANKIDELVLSGHFENNQWNYRETIDTNFDYENLICHKCVKAQNCSKTRSPFFGDMYCESWSDTVETCNDIQF